MIIRIVSLSGYTGVGRGSWRFVLLVRVGLIQGCVIFFTHPSLIAFLQLFRFCILMISYLALIFLHLLECAAQLYVLMYVVCSLSNPRREPPSPFFQAPQPEQEKYADT